MIKAKHLNLLLLSVLISLWGTTQEQPVSYSFFVAGHTYGRPGVKNGLHPPFKSRFNYIKNRNEIKFGIFTGDIAGANPSAEDWDKVDTDIDSLGLPVYFAVGNHDMENRDLYESRYGDTYYSFTHQNDLFIVLDPNLDNWNISGDQLEFIKATLDANTSTTNNIFVFFHQLLWWHPEGTYARIGPNSFEGRSDSINFRTEVEPLFSKLPNEVFMFSGDVGAGSWAVDFMYDKYGNISLIASGMGEGPGDNFVVVNVREDKTVGYDLICLNDSVLNCFGDLTSYRLTTSAPALNSEKMKINVFPNPAPGRFMVSVQSADDTAVVFCLFDSNGKKITCRKIQTNNIIEFVQDLNSGIYFYQILKKQTIIQSGSLLITGS